MALVLLVEDDEDIRFTVSLVLREEGHNVLLACDGVEALDVIFAQHPDVVLLDLMMPDLDGWGFTKAKNADAEVRDIPVIALTAMNSVEARSRGLQEGVQLILRKPIELEQLLVAISAVTKP